jgi:hypothetical protein
MNQYTQDHARLYVNHLNRQRIRTENEAISTEQTTRRRSLSSRITYLLIAVLQFIRR